MKSSTWIGIAVMSFVLVSCGRTGGAPMPGMMMDKAPMAEAAGSYDERSAVVNAPSAGTQASPVPDARPQQKIIYTVDLKIEVKDVPGSLATIDELAKRYGGFVTNSSTQKRANGSRDGSVTVKIAPQRLDEFLVEARKLGELESESKSGQDVTMEYVDLAARLSTKRQLEKELLGLLHTASPKLSDKLEVERELARVREEIETVEGRLRYYDSLVDMATVTVGVYEPDSVMPEERSILFTAVKEAFEGFLRSIGALIIFAAVTAPWILSVVFGLWFLVWIWRRRKR